MKIQSIEIDDELLEEAMKVTGAKTQKEAIEVGLKRLTARERLKRKARLLQGQVRWDGDLDALRRGRTN